MCCVTLQRAALRELFYVSQPTFVIPIFRAPTTSTTTTTTTITSTMKTTITTEKQASNKIFSTMLKQEDKKIDITNPFSSNIINQRIFENLILTNTIVAAFCIILMITLTGFLIFLLIPSIRRRWLNTKPKDDKKLEDLPTLSRQPSHHHFTLSPSRLNPLFEPTTGTATTTTTQFGTLFHPHGTTTLLHPTIWTSMTPTSVVSTPVATQQQQITSTSQPQPPPPSTTTTATKPPTATTPVRPPLPAHPPTTTQRSPRKR